MRYFRDPLNIINNINQVKLFLLDNNIKNQTINNVLEDMQCIAKANAAIKDDINSYAVYAKITPIKIAPQALYGSTVPSESVNLLSVCKSKLIGSELVPDEENLLFSAMIPERSLSALMFGRNTDVGEPITFTSFNGKACPKYNAEYSSDFDYMMLTESHQQCVIDDIEVVKEAIKPFLDNASELKTADIKNIFSKASAVASYSNYRCSTEVKDIVEKMGKNALDLRQEISATTNGFLTKIAKPLVEIENMQSSKQSQLESMCRVSSNLYRGDIKALIEEYKNVIPNQVQEFLTALSQDITRDNVISDQISQGFCKLNQVYGNSNQLFCDEADRLTASDHEDIRQLVVGYSIATDSNTSTNIRFAPQVELVRLNLTNYQLLSLLQSSLSNTWTKATLSRYAAEIIETPSDKENVDTESFIAKYKEQTKKFSVRNSDSDLALCELFNSLSALQEDGVRSKASKQEFLDTVQSIIDLMPDVLAKKKANIKSLAEEIGSSFREDLSSYIGNVVCEHPELGKELVKLTVKK
ncbi:hypothetical protein [Photobacterium damselae]|uniref:hypothetical protein n=1 Tax=Photobacterium damselae TaxID=38293 RepID=UPI001F36B1F7|nr:hypothetical protein [Photobacterium damselae]UKA04986.1 hypothetical protein IHC89_22330 [Photobacterium damselae subsp. damselae]